MTRQLGLSSTLIYVNGKHCWAKVLKFDDYNLTQSWWNLLNNSVSLNFQLPDSYMQHLTHAQYFIINQVFYFFAYWFSLKMWILAHSLILMTLYILLLCACIFFSYKWQGSIRYKKPISQERFNLSLLMSHRTIGGFLFLQVLLQEPSRALAKPVLLTDTSLRIRQPIAPIIAERGNASF